MNYTKGKWYANEIPRNGKDQQYCIASNSGPICLIGTKTPNCYDELTANAQLISAAPDMYEALKEIKKFANDALRGDILASEAAAASQVIEAKCYLALSKAEGRV